MQMVILSSVAGKNGETNKNILSGAVAALGNFCGKSHVRARSRETRRSRTRNILVHSRSQFASIKTERKEQSAYSIVCKVIRVHLMTGRIFFDSNNAIKRDAKRGKHSGYILRLLVKSEIENLSRKN